MTLPPPSQKQARIIWASLTGLGIAIIVGLLGLLVWGLGIALKMLSPVLWPLAIAGILAYLLDPLVDFFVRHKVSRQKAIILVFIIFSGLIIGGTASIVPRLAFEAKELINKTPVYIEQLQKNASEWMAGKQYLFNWREQLRKLVAPKSTTAATTNANEAAVPTANTTTNQPAVAVAPPPERGQDVSEAVFKWLGTALPKVGQWLLKQLGKITSWFEVLIGIALVPVFVFYFLQEKHGIEAGWTNYLPLTESKIKDELVFVLKSINNYLIVFFRGQVLIALCDAVMLSIGFLCMGLNFAVLFGLLAGFLGIIPYLGTILTIVPATLVAAFQFRDIFHPVLVIAIYSLVHTIEGFLIAPKIQGDRVGLHPLTVIVALLVGTTLLGGILGGILAIPLTAALRVIMFRYVWRTRKMKDAVAAEPEVLAK
jgi:predicted PurR-regulated permease PerM